MTCEHSRPRPSVVYAEFPFRISLETLIDMTGKMAEHMSEVAGQLVLEVDGDRQTLVLRYYPEYQDGVP